ncbi:MAG TPA: hypothetical protein VK717_07615 [Opitutaceae bacterium]|jgi:hypothetical protein|nr:hypothetical protein [Opitutaceae bacterium]
MNDRCDTLLSQIRVLEKELVRETQKKEAQFCYQVHAKTVLFTEAAKASHKQARQNFHRYLLHSRFLVLLTAPVIWMCLIPIVLVDVIGSIYQAICFPIYGIPKVHRRDYIAFDRHRLTYLNFIEKLNCDYCAYANGILAYFTEIAARTEQHWCPIKHARCVKCAHSRYKNFVDFGDAEQYRKHFEEIRRAFQDVEGVKTEASPAAGARSANRA